MDNYVLIGKIINSFGIKGEVKMLSSFEYKDRILKKGNFLYIGPLKEKEEIKSYRVHKHYDLISFTAYDNINEILKYKGLNVYAKRSDLHLLDTEYLISDLIGYQVYDEDILLGTVIDYEENNNILLKVKGEKNFYLPLIPNYIKEVLKDEKIIKTNHGQDLIF